MKLLSARCDGQQLKRGGYGKDDEISVYDFALSMRMLLKSVVRASVDLGERKRAMRSPYKAM